MLPLTAKRNETSVLEQLLPLLRSETEKQRSLHAGVRVADQGRGRSYICSYVGVCRYTPWFVSMRKGGSRAEKRKWGMHGKKGA